MKDHRESSIMKKVLASNQNSRENTFRQNKNIACPENLNHEQLTNKLSVIQEVASRKGSIDMTSNKSIGTSQRLTRRQSESNFKNNKEFDFRANQSGEKVEFAKKIMMKRRSFSRNVYHRTNSLLSTIQFEESSIGTINSTIQNRIIT